MGERNLWSSACTPGFVSTAASRCHHANLLPDAQGTVPAQLDSGHIELLITLDQGIPALPLLDPKNPFLASWRVSPS